MEPKHLKIKAVEDYLFTLPSVALDYPFGEDTAVYRVNDKMFALIGSSKTPISLSVKCDPLLSLTLQKKYESVMPGHHLNKKHWITILLSCQMPWEEVKDLINLSYYLVNNKPSIDPI